MENLEYFLGGTFVLFLLISFFAWVTHIVWWVSLVISGELDTISEAVIAIIGTLFAPVGVIHGFILWFT